MLYEKQEILDNLRDYSEAYGLDEPTENILDELDTPYSFNPFNNNGYFIFKTVEGFLSVPTAYREEIGQYLDIDKAYIASENEIQSALKLLKQCYEEILTFVRSDY